MFTRFLTILFLLFTLCSGARATITYDGTNGQLGGSQHVGFTTLSFAISSTGTNEVIALFIYWDVNGTAVTPISVTPTDSQAHLTFSFVGGATGTTSTGGSNGNVTKRIECWTAYATTALTADTINITIPQTSYISFAGDVIGLKGASSATPNASSITMINQAATYTSSVTPAQASGVFGINIASNGSNPVGYTPTGCTTTGYSGGQSQNVFEANCYVTLSNVSTLNTAQTLTWGDSSGQTQVGIEGLATLAFTPGAGGGSTTPPYCFPF